MKFYSNQYAWYTFSLSHLSNLITQIILRWVIPVVLINYIIIRNVLNIWSKHNYILSHRLVHTTTCFGPVYWPSSDCIINLISSYTILNSWFRASWFNVNKKVQLDATVCRHLFTAQSLYMFQVSQHPSSGVLKTISATSGIGHDTGTAASFQRGLIRPLWKEVVVPVSWPIPEVADTDFSTPDDGCCDTRNM